MKELFKKEPDAQRYQNHAQYNLEYIPHAEKINENTREQAAGNHKPESGKQQRVNDQ